MAAVGNLHHTHLSSAPSKAAAAAHVACDSSNTLATFHSSAFLHGAKNTPFTICFGWEPNLHVKIRCDLCAQLLISQAVSDEPDSRGSCAAPAAIFTAAASSSCQAFAKKNGKCSDFPSEGMGGDNYECIFVVATPVQSTRFGRRHFESPVSASSLQLLAIQFSRCTCSTDRTVRAISARSAHSVSAKSAAFGFHEHVPESDRLRTQVPLVSKSATFHTLQAYASGVSCSAVFDTVRSESGGDVTCRHARWSSEASGAIMGRRTTPNKPLNHSNMLFITTLEQEGKVSFLKVFNIKPPLHGPWEPQTSLCGQFCAPLDTSVQAANILWLSTGTRAAYDKTHSLPDRDRGPCTQRTWAGGSPQEPQTLFAAPHDEPQPRFVLLPCAGWSLDGIQAWDIQNHRLAGALPGVHDARVCCMSPSSTHSWPAGAQHSLIVAGTGHGEISIWRASDVFRALACGRATTAAHRLWQQALQCVMAVGFRGHKASSATCAKGCSGHHAHVGVQLFANFGSYQLQPKACEQVQACCTQSAGVSTPALHTPPASVLLKLVHDFELEHATTPAVHANRSIRSTHVRRIMPGDVGTCTKPRMPSLAAGPNSNIELPTMATDHQTSTLQLDCSDAYASAPCPILAVSSLRRGTGIECCPPSSRSWATRDAASGVTCISICWVHIQHTNYIEHAHCRCHLVHNPHGPRANGTPGPEPPHLTTATPVAASTCAYKCDKPASLNQLIAIGLYSGIVLFVLWACDSNAVLCSLEWHPPQPTAHCRPSSVAGISLNPTKTSTAQQQGIHIKVFTENGLSRSAALVVSDRSGHQRARQTPPGTESTSEQAVRQ